METLNNFTHQKPRPLPVIIAVDRSGSMSVDGKITALNYALNEFVDSMKKESSSVAEIQLALFSFGANGVTCDMPLTPLEQFQFAGFIAQGNTPMGEAFQLIKEMIEDRERVPSRAYRPTIVLLTDGQPNDDEWETKLAQLINDGRSSKAFRIAMAIGEDADKEMLMQFVSNPEYLVSGENARDIYKFFRFVTMSVTQRLKSQSPDQIAAPVIPSDDIIDF